MSRTIPCPVLARHRLPGALNTIQKLRCGWVASVLDTSIAFILDHDLSLATTLDLGTLGYVPDMSRVSVSPCGELIAIASASAATVHSSDGHHLAKIAYAVPWPGGGGLRLMDDGILWCAVPADARGDHGTLLVMNVLTAETVATGEFPVWVRGHRPNSIKFIPLHDPGSMLTLVIDAFGQSWVFRTDLRSDTCDSRKLPIEGRCITSDDVISPNGEHFVAAPVGSTDTITVHDAQHGQIVAETPSGALHPDPLDPEQEDYLWSEAQYLTGHVLIGNMKFGRLLAIDRASMTIEGIITPTGVRPHEHDGQVLPGHVYLRPLGVTPAGNLVIEHQRQELLLVDPSPVLEQDRGSGWPT